MSLLKTYHLFGVFVQFVQFFGRFSCVKSFEHKFFSTLQVVNQMRWCDVVFGDKCQAGILFKNLRIFHSVNFVYANILNGIFDLAHLGGKRRVAIYQKGQFFEVIAKLCKQV